MAATTIGILTWLVLEGAHAFIFSTVPCPNMAKNCITDTFNTVMPNLGCLGCQGGCVKGYMMTNNPKHARETNDTLGHYIYQTMMISNNVDVFEPQWICTPGDDCLPGYFLSDFGPQTSCAYCGEGCSKCSSFHECQACFPGYQHTTHTLPGGQQTSTCKNSGVLCPSKTSHCAYPMYLSSGGGCLGCVSCDEGYLPTFNPLYYDHTADSHAPYTYSNITIRGDRNVNEPRFICVKGTKCADGWYERQVMGAKVCDGCSDNCAKCSDRRTCMTCKSGFVLDAASKSCTQSTSGV